MTGETRVAKNPELRRACEAWMSAALKLLANRRIYGRPDLEITFSPGSHSERPIVSPDYKHLVVGTDLVELDETSVVVRIVQHDPNVSMALLGTTQWDPPLPQLGNLMIAGHTLSPLLIQYLIRSDYITSADRTSIVPAVFDDVYTQLEQVIYERESISVFRLVQFRNLKTELDTIDLGDRIRIRRASDEERKQAVKGSSSAAGSAPGMDVYEMFTNPAFTSEQRDLDNVPDVFLEIAGHRGDARDEDVEAYAEKLVLALRLISDVPVATHSFWYVDTNPLLAIVPPRYVRHETLLPLANPATPYVIRQETADRLEKLWPELELRITDPRLELAVRRLDDSYYRKRPDDRLIDLWIALEALFLAYGKGELRFRAALTIAHFLRTSQADRLALFKEVQESYDLRSKMVHGVQPEPKHKLPEVTDSTGDLLRQALLLFLRKRKAPQGDAILASLLT